jgi:hypothetical protein
MTRKLSWLVVVILLLTAVPVLAGGWAVVTLDDMPAEIHAGESYELHFMVRQHGNTPVHFFAEDNNSPVEPVLMATNKDTGEVVRVEATRAKEVGRFYLEVTFPSEGTWEWTIAPEPLMGEGTFPPLTVLAPIATGSTVKDTGVQPSVAEPATQIEAAPAVQEPAAPSTATTTAAPVNSTTTIARSALQWGAITLLVVAIALLLIQRRAAVAPRPGTQESGD